MQSRIMAAALALAAIAAGPALAWQPKAVGVAKGWPAGPGQASGALTLNTLVLSTTAATAGQPFTANILNRTAGSSLALTNTVGGKYSLSGLTLTGSGLTAGVDQPQVTETLAGAVNSPKLNTFAIVVSSGGSSAGTLDLSNPSAVTGLLSIF